MEAISDYSSVRFETCVIFCAVCGIVHLCAHVRYKKNMYCLNSYDIIPGWQDLISSSCKYSSPLLIGASLLPNSSIPMSR